MERSRLFCIEMNLVILNAIAILEILKPAIVGEGDHMLKK